MHMQERDLKTAEKMPITLHPDYRTLLATKYVAAQYDIAYAFLCRTYIE
jgi:hypothetical protein